MVEGAAATTAAASSFSSLGISTGVRAGGFDADGLFMRAQIESISAVAAEGVVGKAGFLTSWLV